MPKYGLHKYGRFKYGKYNLSASGSGGQAIGPHIRYRIRSIDENDRKTRFITMNKTRVSIPSRGVVKTRMRIDEGRWVRTQNERINKKASKVRIRSTGKDGHISPWVFGDTGRMQ